MTRIIFMLLAAAAGTSGFAQSAAQNYVKETIYKEGFHPGVIILNSSSNNDFVTTTYYDGFDRPMQQVQHNASPADEKNIVTHIEYEKNIGQTKEYLPFASDGSTADFISDAGQSTQNYYMAAYGAEGINPYSEKRMETTPNPRVLEIGAPGADWQIPTTYEIIVPMFFEDPHTIRYSYGFNAANEVKKFDAAAAWNSSRELYNTAISENGFYPAESLRKTVVKNENWKAGDGNNNTTEEFKGTDGKVVLKRAYNNGQPHDTYYVYDFYGNLSYVIPPLAQGSIAGTNLGDLCYQYLYDEKNRLVEKKQPQKGWEYIVYDKADRIVMTGPANNPFDASAPPGWMMSKYDPLGRTVYTGFYTGHTVNSENRKAVKTAIYAQTDNNETKSTADTTIDGTAVRYSNTKFPTSFNLLTVNYYDGYDFPGAPASFPAVEGVTPVQNIKGLAAGSWTRILTTASERKAEVSYTLYNARYQPLRTHTVNYLGGFTQTDNQLTFRGLPVKTTTTHKRTASDPLLSVTNNFSYDHRERLKAHTQQINGGAAELIAENTYDELGKLTGKKVGNTSAVPLQDIGYRYNIRGWLTGFNAVAYDPWSAGSYNGLFNYAILYNHTFEGDTSAPQYNGNISSVSWRTQTDNEIRGYGYDYDHLNRLNYASHLKGTLGFFYTNYQRDGQYAEDLSYDKNGNILTLQRYGEEISGQAVEIDDLDYTYAGNQLQSVTDATNNSEGFHDGNTAGVDYVYDSFGNMTEDKNKGITNVTYNYLNQPTEITFAGGTINYTYDAGGTKLKKTVQPAGGTAQTTDYLHGFEYENTDLKTFPHPEGYVKKDGANYIYHYIYRDHLGNNRLVYADLNNDGVIQPAAEIVEENNYYPFGLKHQGYNDLPGAGYKHKFLNKEYESSFGLNVTETDFRQYDSALGRFHTADLLSELAPNQTPYRYGFNNPVFWSDPSGLFETEEDAKNFAILNGISSGDYRITRNTEKGGYNLVVIGGEFNGKTFYGFNDTLTEMIIDAGGDAGGGGGFGSGMFLSEGFLGIASTTNTVSSGYLKYNNVWHKTKTRGYSFSWQDKWKNPGAEYWRNQQIKPHAASRAVGRVLTGTGGVFIVGDILMSGQVRPSHIINGVMIGASLTGFGSIASSLWFLADYGTGAYNYIFTPNGFRTISDIIDERFGTYQMYEGLY